MILSKAVRRNYTNVYVITDLTFLYKFPLEHFYL